MTQYILGQCCLSFHYYVVEYVPALDSIFVKEFIIDSLNFYRDEYLIKINAYVIMPEHFHLIIK